MSVVILCEKREQGMKVGKGLGLSQGNNCYQGDWEGKPMTVVWAAGHLLRLQTPEEEKADVSWSDSKTLMPVPVPIEKVPTDRGRKYLGAMKPIIRKASEVWIGTDPDREGEAIGRDILAHLGYKGRVRRMWMTGTLEPKDIKTYTRTLLAGEKHLPHYRAQEARNRSDWMWQLLVMAYTNAGRRGVLGEELSKGTGKASVVSLGRVQTTALWIVVDRDRLIKNFVPTEHFKLNIHVSGIDLHYKPVALPDGKVEGLTRLDNGSPLFTSVDKMKAFAARIKAHEEVTVVQADYADKPKNPPLPHSLDSLQRSMFQKKGMTSADALKVADKLRLEGYLTYPRTEHREVPESLYNNTDLPAILSSCATVPGLSEPAANMKQSHPGERMPACFTNKPMEHHGIIPTEKAPNWGALSDIEKGVYAECAKAFVVAMHPQAVYRVLSVIATAQVSDPIDNATSQFEGKYRTVLEPGWLSIEKALKSKQEGQDGVEEAGEGSKDGVSEVSALPDLAPNTSAKIQNTQLKKATTKKPSHYTESSLLAAMKNAGRFAEGENAKVLRSVNGIGTSATRASIIEILLGRNYLVRSGKGSRAKLVSTDKANALMTNISPELRDVNNTAKWETQLNMIAAETDIRQAESRRDQFVEDQAAFLSRHIQHISNNVETHIQEHGNERKYDGEPSKKMLSLARKLAKEQGVSVPGNVKTSFQACKSFIDKHISASKKQPQQVKKPTEKMVSFAKSVAEKKGVTLSKELESFAECKKFLDQNAPKKA